MLANKDVCEMPDSSPDYQYYYLFILSIPKALSDDWEKQLFSLSCVGIETSEIALDQTKMRVYFEAHQDIEVLEAKILKIPLELFKIESSSFGIPLNTKSRYQAQDISLTDHFSILPASTRASLSYQNSPKKRIFLKSGAAFGTGLHPTTRLVAAMMEKLNFFDEVILDVGTGTGVLAILAKLLGAKRVDTIEISSIARTLAKENFELNSMKEIKIYSELSQAPHIYSLVIANLMTSTLTHLKKELKAHLQPEASILFSGILKSERQKWINVYSDFKIYEESELEGWLCIYGSFE